MAINFKVTTDEKKQINQFAKIPKPVKLVNPQEKIGEKIPKDFNPRGR
jgi:hypothetical protein